MRPDRLVPVTGLNRSDLAPMPGTHDRKRDAGKPGQMGPDRLVPVTGLNRSDLAPGTHDRKRDAGTPGSKGRRASHPEGKRGGRPVKYGEGFVKALGAIWDEFSKPRGKLLAPMTGGTIDFPAESEEPRYGITEGIRGLLLEVSAAEADLRLKPARKAFATRGYVFLHRKI
jgi:hypothetical protein